MNLHDIKDEKHDWNGISRTDQSSIKSLIRGGAWDELECGCLNTNRTGPARIQCPGTWKYGGVRQECMHPGTCQTMH